MQYQVNLSVIVDSKDYKNALVDAIAKLREMNSVDILYGRYEDIDREIKPLFENSLDNINDLV